MQFPPVVALRATQLVMKDLEMSVGSSAGSDKPTVTVFDPYSGWGDRLIGVTALTGVKYIGVDSNAELKEHYSSMMEFHQVQYDGVSCTNSLLA